MPYVSCRYGPPLPPELVDAGFEQQIICVDEDGQEWFPSSNSQNGDWLRFQADGGTIEPYEEPG